MQKLNSHRVVKLRHLFIATITAAIILLVGYCLYITVLPHPIAGAAGHISKVPYVGKHLSKSSLDISYLSYSFTRGPRGAHVILLGHADPKIIIKWLNDQKLSLWENCPDEMPSSIKFMCRKNSYDIEWDTDNWSAQGQMKGGGPYVLCYFNPTTGNFIFKMYQLNRNVKK